MRVYSVLGLTRSLLLLGLIVHSKRVLRAQHEAIAQSDLGGGGLVVLLLFKSCRILKTQNPRAGFPVVGLPWRLRTVNPLTNRGPTSFPEDVATTTHTSRPAFARASRPQSVVVNPAHGLLPTLQCLLSLSMCVRI